MTLPVPIRRALKRSLHRDRDSVTLPDMPADIPRSTVWKATITLCGGLALGITLLAVAVVSDEPPAALWITGGLLTAFFGYQVGFAIMFRLRNPTPEARAAARERRLAGYDGRRRDAARDLVAHEATKHRRAVLRDGVEGTAMITFVADGHRGNDSTLLVYLELDVRVSGTDAYPVRTGEYLTAASTGAAAPGRELLVKVDHTDPQRVAVDWERSLRVQPGPSVLLAGHRDPTGDLRP